MGDKGVGNIGPGIAAAGVCIMVGVMVALTNNFYLLWFLLLLLACGNGKSKCN